MGKREIWLEGTFAGEITVDEKSDDEGACDEFGWESSSQDSPPEPWAEWEDSWDAEGAEEPDEGRGDEDAKSAGDTPKKKSKKRKKAKNKEIGRRGEAAAARYLKRMGYEIVEQNYVCPFGEADIIARDGETLAFIEVKTRTGISKGFPSEAVDAQKRRKYEKIAAWYLAEFEETDIPVRFDVIAILVVAEDRAFLRHYVNAFGGRI